MKILGINSGVNKHGTLSKLLDEALTSSNAKGKELGERVLSDTIYLCEHEMPHHDGSFDKIPRGLRKTFNKMVKADGIIFATPVNWFAPNDRMVSFVAWMTYLETKKALRGKVFGVIATCNDDGGHHTTMNLAGAFAHMGMFHAPEGLFYHNRHVASASEDQWQMHDHKRVGKNMAQMIYSLRKQKTDWE